MTTGTSDTNSSSRATSQDLEDQSDVSSSENSASTVSSANKPATSKKQKLNIMKKAKVTLTDKDDNTSDVDELGQDDKLNSPKPTTTHKQSTPKATKSKSKPVADGENDDAEAEENPTKKLAAVSKSKPSTVKKAAATNKRSPVVSDDTPTVSDAENEKPLKNAASAKPNKKRARTSTNDGLRKKPKLPTNAYIPDSYESLNKADKTLFDLKTQNPSHTWKEIAVQYNLVLQTMPETTTNALEKRWARVNAAGTEIEHDDIQKMCVYKRDMENEIEREKDRVLRKFKDNEWMKIAEYVARNGGKDYDPDVLQRKYGIYKRHGRIDENDNYTEWTKEEEEETKIRKHSKPLLDKDLHDTGIAGGDDEETAAEDNADGEDELAEDDVDIKVDPDKDTNMFGDDA
ncbi:hypothetical protein SBOR_3697 [Sclerotinia borealis F-4128]|uniref:Uncharacterized protein n=1 Tax=Sclerotinia borealis (strain F-4128) TaxID=1432307 RepID=W9CMM3_SCLBF|nr:hypothetical protein SBOR_3697 [Sclerotinia borealis F-4128]